MNNIPITIQNKLNKKLHNQVNHPIWITKNLIYQCLPDFEYIDNLFPLVTIQQNFDLLRIPFDHPSRKTSDTYYQDENHVLRTHTSAHQIDLLKQGKKQFLVAGDVYRKDDIDQTHYPIFHQLEGVKLCNNPAADLKKTLSLVIDRFFPGAEWRWKEDYFPFTHPSWEVEVKYQDQWLEILGCGVIHPEVLGNAGLKDQTGWAFGIGLDRIAMRLFQIPDIRLLWSEDPRFLSQFNSNKIITFKPYSKYPACYKDISFWINSNFASKDMLDIIRTLGGDIIEKVDLLDQFTNKNGKQSQTYRIIYRSWDRSLTNEEVDLIQNKIREEISKKLAIQLR